MLIRHSSEILVNRLAQIEARSVEASQALVAKIRGDMMISAAIEKLDAPKGGPDPQVLDKSA